MTWSWIAVALAVLACIAAVATGCSGPRSLRSQRGFGMVKTYDAAPAAAFAAAVDALKAKGLTVDSADEAAGEILARQPSTLMRWGENIAVWVSPAGDNRAKVEVAMGQAAGNRPDVDRWDQFVHNALAERFQAR